MFRMGRTSPRLAVVVLAVLVSTACTSGQASPIEAVPLSDFLEFESPEQQVSWSRNRHFAVEAATERCMEADRFDYVPAPFIESSVPIRPISRVDRAERGYGRFSMSNPSPLTTPGEVDDVLEGLSDSEYAEWLAAVEGCRSEAWEMINGAWAEPRAIIQDALDDLNASIAADERTIDLDRQWSACMAGGGWVVGRPQEVLDLSERLIPQPLTEDGMDEALAKEVKIALADFDCKASLAGKYLEVRAVHEREFIQKNEAELFAIREEINRVELTVD